MAGSKRTSRALPAAAPRKRTRTAAAATAEVRLASGQAIALDGDLVFLIDALYREFAVRLGFAQASGDVLMVAHMNPEALAKTITTGEAWFYSRSRQKLWKKGESSGHTQRVVEMRVDCDQDAVWIKVEQGGPGACHTGRRSCFYRAVPLGARKGAVTLEFRDADRAFDPNAVYGDPDKSR